MNAVAAADHRSELVLYCPTGDRIAKMIQIIEQNRAGGIHLHRQRRAVEHKFTPMIGRTTEFMRNR